MRYCLRPLYQVHFGLYVNECIFLVYLGDAAQERGWSMLENRVRSAADKSPGNVTSRVTEQNVAVEDDGKNDTKREICPKSDSRKLHGAELVDIRCLQICVPGIFSSRRHRR